MNQNVKIPFSVLSQAIYVLEHINMDNYDDTLRNDYDNVLAALYYKKEALNLREAYAKIINAKDEGSRLLARIQYLELKRELRGDI